MFNPQTIYDGSDADATRAMYEHLERLGPVGIVALNLFRASKCSQRAKDYRSYRARFRVKKEWSRNAYERKSWSLGNLCEALNRHAGALGVAWGWKPDPAMEGFPWVLYVDLPNGQVSFHADRRGVGPDYPGEWDGQKGESAARVIWWVESVLRGAAECTEGT